MELPSRKLLDAVMKDSPTVNPVFIDKFNYEVFVSALGDSSLINILALVRLMKTWALGKGFYVLSMIDEFGGMALVSTKKNSNIHNEVASEEAEAVFKICEWILNQQKDK